MIEDKKWDKFLQTIKNRNCCLLLGPEISCLADKPGTNLSVLDAFSEFMRKRLDDEHIEHDNAIQNFYYRANRFINKQYPPDRPSEFSEEILSFANARIAEPCTYFNTMVRLPFNTIVNMVPDEFICNALDNQGYEFVKDHYDYTSNTNSTAALSEEMQLVYNLFGTYDNPQSVAVTEKDQLSLVKNIVAGKPALPTSLITRFKDRNKSFLFLGFNFNDWYFRLIIDSLQIPKPVHSFYPVYSNSHQVAFLTQEFYNEKFGIQFVAQDTDQFVAELLARYQTNYGSLERKLLCVLDYSLKDSAMVKEMHAQFMLNKLKARVDFWYREKDLVPGLPLSTIDDQARNADIYLPFLSKDFVNDADCMNRINAALYQDKTGVIPILAGYGAFEAAIPDLRKRSLLILPREDKTPLSAMEPVALSKACSNLASIINCIIR